MVAFARRAVLVLLAVQALAGLLWTAQQLGELPHYGDSNEYLRLAGTLRVDAHRGILYPAFLAGVDRISPGQTMLRPIATEHPDGVPCPVPGGVLLVQLLQLALCGAALLYFFATFRAVLSDAWRPSRPVMWWLCALVLFDPLVAHFALSIMPDALALAATLVFCAALVRFGLGLGAPAPAAALLLLSFLASATLRPEKGWVLIGVAVASAAAWGWLGRRRRVAWVPRQVLVSLGLVVLGMALAGLSQRAVHRDYGRPGQAEIVMNARIVFPHLADIHPALEPSTRALFSEADLAEYDKHVLNPGPVLRRVAKGDREVARRLTRELAGVALQQRAGAIAFDTVKDAVENALPGLGWYGRLAAVRVYGIRNYASFSRSDGTPWTARLMRRHHPRSTRAFVGLSALSGAVALGILVSLLVSRRLRVDPQGWAAIAPCALFALGNGLLFAVHADQVNPRYTIGAGAMQLAALYALALAWARRPGS